MRRILIPLLVLLIGAISRWQQQGAERLVGGAPAVETAGEAGADRPEARPRGSSGLPDEARDTIELIQQGGPFPYRQDDKTFGNREGLLPDAARGYYREYTVPTPGSPDRGARRIVTGGDPPAEWYYTDDHYRSFRPFDPDQESPP